MDSIIIEMIKIGGLPVIFFLIFAFYAYKTNGKFMDIIEKSNEAEKKIAEALISLNENIRRCSKNQGN